MNAIFKNDSELVRLLSSKKVYPHVKEEILEIVKKSAVNPLESKENIVLNLGKGEKSVDTTMVSPRAFAEVNRVI